MVFQSLAEIEARIRSSWSEKTCDPVDLREQFTRAERLLAPAVVTRPADPSVGRLAAQYRALAAAVHGREH